MGKKEYLSPLLLCLYFLLCNHDIIVAQVTLLLILNCINEFISQLKGKHFLFILMQIFCKFDDLLTLCSSDTTFNLTEHWSVIFFIKSSVISYIVYSCDGLLFNFLLNQLYNAIRAACCISSRSIQSLFCSLMSP